MKKEKYLQIFNYLLEFSKLKSKPVRDIDNSETQYPDKIYFAAIPQHELFECITHPNFNQDSDYWLKVYKPKEPEPPVFPKISDNLQLWVVKESLLDENGFPLLNQSIIKNDKTLLLSEHPKIEKEFHDYLNNKWIDDLEFYKREYSKYENKFAEFKRLNEIYKRLFSIYNKAQQFGEEYELVIGAGLLNFKENDNTPLIRRHILTSKAEIVFESDEESSYRDSFIKVSPSLENNIQIETDAIIDLFEQFETGNIIEAEKKIFDFLKEKNLIDNPFDKLIKDAIQIFADRLRSDGQFKDELEQPKEISKKPTIYFSPALILRKRNTRSLTTLYEKIINNINNANDDINIHQINDIIGHSHEIINSADGLVNSSSENFIDETIYFPKKYNSEQVEIIQKTRKNSKVLVQGPPGTGKSHTIANLICHLLANGKKILVTAYTKRALEVLHNQFNEEEELKEFKNLIVNLLSGDSSSIQSLEASVNAINDELSRVNMNELSSEIEQLKEKLSLIKEDKATTKNEWLKVKEKSIRKQSINSIYQGTVMEIAEQIEKDLLVFGWFKDKIADINKLAIIPDIEKFISLSNYYKNIDCSIFNYIIPKKENIISLNELKEYLNINNLFKKYSSCEPHISIECKDFQKLKEQLDQLFKLDISIENNAFLFETKTQIIKDYQIDFAYFKNILIQTENLLKKLPFDNLKNLDKNIEITYPKNRSLIQLKNDAQILYSYVKEKNKLSGIIFNLKKTILPKNIKEKLYFIKEVNVNGSPCDTENEFEMVLDDINIKQDLKELENLWPIKYNEDTKFYFDKAKFFKQLSRDTENLINKIIEANKIREQIESLSSLKINNQIYDSEKVNKLIDETEYNAILAKINFFEKKIVEINKYLSMQNTHPIASQLIKDIKDFDSDEYEQHLNEIYNLIIEKEKYSIYKQLQENLQQNFPILIDEILKGEFNFSNIQQIEKAICFKHALTEISKLLEDDYETNLRRKLDEYDHHEVKLISEIASKKAWLNVLEKLTDNRSMRQHLQAWVHAMKKIGKTGTSKRALKFRKEAQYQMEQCKDSVPCWIMPLYKVAETINPEQGMYDYVIIDEASQLGPDAIFLLYISKNTIIVGDDKQTSPEYVGVDANTMAPFIKKFLQDIPFANFFGTEFSFFDHAERFCDGITVLREHFRCMPEIIEFSNKHFYSPNGKGLFPLKQYSDKRLEPLKNFYCQNGYIDGQSQNIINRIEVEEITNKIAELICNKQYEDKTFGVIALQGNKQASLIESLLLKRIGEVEYIKRKIICGNSASFQGDERDIMFLSLVTAHNHNRIALTKPEDERRFNVAVSRAKEQVWLFHSIQLEDLSNPNDLRYKLLDHFLNYKRIDTWRNDIIPVPDNKKEKKYPDEFRSWFEVEVYNDIVSKGYKSIPNYKVLKGRYEIDLVPILNNGTKIAIECDGDIYHGPEQYLNDLMRQKVLERCGWQFFRVRGAEYYSNRKKALEPLWELLRLNENQKKESQNNQ